MIKRILCLLAPLTVASLLATAQDNQHDTDLHALVGQLKAIVEQQQEQIRSLQQKVATLEESKQDQPPDQTALTGTAPLAEKDSTGRAPAPLPADPAPKVASRFDLDFYGYIKLDAAYDSQRTVNGDLAFSALPDSGSGDDDAFSLTAKQTRFGMKVAAPDVAGWHSAGRLEIDFYGSASDNAANPRMRLAFLQLKNGPWSLLAGQDYDAWNTVLPKTVNFATMGRHGALWSRRPQLRLTRRFDLAGDSTVSATVAAARTIGTTDIDAAGDGLDGGEDSGLPMLQWNVKYNATGNKDGLTMALGGHYGTEEVERDALHRDASFVTSMLIGSVHLPLNPAFQLSGTLWTGENLGNFQGAIGQRLNLARNTEIAASGGWIQAAWYPVNDLNINFSYGIDNPKDADVADGSPDRNETYFTNLYWTFLPSTTFALEYQYLKTGYKNATEATTHRLQSALIFKF